MDEQRNNCAAPPGQLAAPHCSCKCDCTAQKTNTIQTVPLAPPTGAPQLDTTITPWTLTEGDSCAASPAKRIRSDETSLLRELAEEFECSICSKLLHDPVSTPCGHSFCRACLARALDFRDCCPLCRTILHLEEAAALPVTRALHAAILRAFPDASRARAQEAAAEASGPDGGQWRLPLFPLNKVVFPGQAFTMHIYEPRYRLMLRRIMAGSRKFGLVALRPAPGGCSTLCNVGCVLEVVRAHRMPDGRSLIETVGRERFRVLSRSEVDGYLVGRTEVVCDTRGLEGVKVREVEGRARGIIATLTEERNRLGPAEKIDLSCLQDALRRSGEVPADEEGPSALGLWLSGVLVTDKRERQRLLEMNDAAERLAEMAAVLEQFRDSLLATSRNASVPLSNRECCLQ